MLYMQKTRDLLQKQNLVLEPLPFNSFQIFYIEALVPAHVDKNLDSTIEFEQ